MGANLPPSFLAIIQGECFWCRQLPLFFNQIPVFSQQPGFSVATLIVPSLTTDVGKCNYIPHASIHMFPVSLSLSLSPASPYRGMKPGYHIISKSAPISMVWKTLLNDILFPPTPTLSLSLRRMGFFKTRPIARKQMMVVTVIALRIRLHPLIFLFLVL